MNDVVASQIPADLPIRRNTVLLAATMAVNSAVLQLVAAVSSLTFVLVTGVRGLLGLGPYLNVLPLITVGLFLVTQRMSMPEPTNEQAAMQQKMMKYMTMFMGLLFYKVASGLCLYFIASSLWGIAPDAFLR